MKLENLHSAVKNVQSNLHQLKKQQQKQQTNNKYSNNKTKN